MLVPLCWPKNSLTWSIITVLKFSSDPYCWYPGQTALDHVPSSPRMPWNQAYKYSRFTSDGAGELWRQKTWHWWSLWAHNCRFWAISETPCLFNLKSRLQWKSLPLEIPSNLIAIEMHKWNDKSCILPAIIAIFFYLLESDLCCIDELHFFKVYFPISKVRLFIKWLAWNAVLPSPAASPPPPYLKNCPKSEEIDWEFTEPAHLFLRVYFYREL